MNWVLITMSFFLVMLTSSMNKSSVNKMNENKKISKTLMKWSW